MMGSDKIWQWRNVVASRSCRGVAGLAVLVQIGIYRERPYDKLTDR